MKHMSYLGNYDLRYPNVFHDTYPNDKVLYIVKKKRHVQVLIKYRDGKRLHISQIAISQKENNNKYLFDVFAIHLDFADSKQLWKFADDFVSMIHVSTPERCTRRRQMLYLSRRIHQRLDADFSHRATKRIRLRDYGQKLE